MREQNVVFERIVELMRMYEDDGVVLKIVKEYAIPEYRTRAVIFSCRNHGVEWARRQNV